MNPQSPGTPRLDLHTELRRVQQQLQDETVSFNFDTFVHKTDCGTTCCIAGWIRENNREVFGRTHYQTLLGYFGRTDQVMDLFGMGPEWRLDWNEKEGDFFYHHSTGVRREKVRADQAIIAIENFITRGAPHWEEILSC